MAQKTGFCCLLALAAFFMAVPLAAAAPSVETISSNSVSLSPDPFLEVASVTTAIYAAKFCTCAPESGCAFQPEGQDCANPSNCCHCYGPIPSQRQCVGN